MTTRWLLLALLVASPAGADGWSFTLGRDSALAATEVSPTPDGGFLVAGSSDEGFAWLLRLAPDGTTTTPRTLSTASPGQPVHCAATPDGGAVVAGTLDGPAGRHVPWIVRLDASLDRRTQLAFDVGRDTIVGALAIQANGEAVVALPGGSSTCVAWWGEASGIRRVQFVPGRIQSLSPTAEGGVVAAALVQSGNSALIRFDSNGDIVAATELLFGCAAMTEVAVTSRGDGTFVVVGAHACAGQWPATVVAMVDASLAPGLAVEIHAADRSPVIRSIARVPGGFVAAGRDGVTGSAVVLRLDSALNITWQRELRSGASSFAALAPMADGGAVAVGSWRLEALLSRFDGEGSAGGTCGGRIEGTYEASRAVSGTATLPVDTSSWGASILPSGLAAGDVTFRRSEIGDSHEPDSCAVPRDLLPGLVLAHDFCDDSEDWFLLRACEGTRYDVVTSSLGSLADTVVDLFDGDCSTPVASDDDGGAGAASRLQWIAPRDGTFLVRVSQRDGSAGPDRGYDVELVQVGPGCRSWMRSFGLDEPARIMALRGGGVMALGSRIDAQSARPSGKDPAVMRLGPSGDVVSVEAVAVPGPNDWGSLAPHGAGHVLAGTATIGASIGAWVRVVAADGAALWERVYVAGRPVGPSAVAGLADGGVVVALPTSVGGWTDAWLLRLDARGDVAWSRAVRTGSTVRAVLDLAERPDGTIVVVGDDVSLGLFVVVLDAAGNRVSDAVRDVAGTAVAADVGPSGEVVAAGGPFVTMIDPGGALRWSLALGDSAILPACMGVVATRDGGCVIVGRDGRDVTQALAARLDASGRVTWSRSLREASPPGVATFVDVDALEDGGFVALARSGTILRLDADGRVGASCPDDAAVPQARGAAADSLARTMTILDVPLALVAEGDFASEARGMIVLESCAATGTRPPGEVSGLRVDRGGVISWERPVSFVADSFDVYRGSLADLRSRNQGTCLASRVVGVTLTDAEPPPPSGCWTYLVTAVSAQGEGTMGFDSFGVERVNLAPCP